MGTSDGGHVCVSEYTDAGVTCCVGVGRKLWVNHVADGLSIRTPEGDVVNRIPSESAVTCLHSAGGRVWVGHQDGLLEAYSPKTCSKVVEFVQHTGAILSLDALADTRLFSASEDFTVCQFDPRQLLFIRRYPGHTNAVVSLACTPCHLYSGSRDASIRVWHCEKGMCVHKLTHTDPVLALRLDGKQQLWCTFADGSVKVWSADTHELITQWREDVPVQCFAAVANGMWGGTSSGLIVMWQVDPPVLLTRVKAHDHPVTCLTTVHLRAERTSVWSSSSRSLKWWERPQQGSCLDCGQLRLELSTLQSHCATNDMARLDEELHALQAQFRSLGDEKSDLVEEKNTLEVITGRAVEDLQRDIITLQKRSATDHLKRDLLESENRALQEEVKNLQGQVDDLRGSHLELGEVRSQWLRLQAELTDMETESRGLRRQQTEGEVEHQRKLHAAQLAAESAQHTVTQTQQQVTHLEAEVERMGDEVERMRQEKSDAIQRADQAEAETQSVNRRFHELKTSNDVLRQQGTLLAVQVRERDEAIQDLSEGQKENRALHQRVHVLEARLKAAEEDNTVGVDAQQALSELEQRMTEMETENDELLEQVKGMAEERQEAVGQLEFYRQQLDTIKDMHAADTQQWEVERKALTMALGNRDEELAELQQKWEEATEELQQQLEQETEQHGVARTQLMSHTQSVEHLRTQLAKAHSELTERQRNITQLREQLRQPGSPTNNNGGSSRGAPTPCLAPASPDDWDLLDGDQLCNDGDLFALGAPPSSSSSAPSTETTPECDRKKAQRGSSSLLTEITTLKQCVETKDEVIDALRRQLYQATEAQCRLNEQLTTATETAEAKQALLRRTVEDREEALAALTTRGEQLQKDADIAQKVSKAARCRVSALQMELDARSKAAASVPKPSAVDQELVTVRQYLEQSKEELVALQNAYDRLHEAHAHSSQYITELEGALTQRDAEWEDVRRTNKQSQEEETTLVTQLRQDILQKEIDAIALNCVINHINTRVKSKEKALQDALSKCCQLEEQLMVNHLDQTQLGHHASILTQTYNSLLHLHHQWATFCRHLHGATADISDPAVVSRLQVLNSLVSNVDTTLRAVVQSLTPFRGSDTQIDGLRAATPTLSAATPPDAASPVPPPPPSGRSRTAVVVDSPTTSTLTPAAILVNPPARGEPARRDRATPPPPAAGGEPLLDTVTPTPWTMMSAKGDASSDHRPASPSSMEEPIAPTTHNNTNNTDESPGNITAEQHADLRSLEAQLATLQGQRARVVQAKRLYTKKES